MCGIVRDRLGPPCKVGLEAPCLTHDDGPQKAIKLDDLPACVILNMEKNMLVSYQGPHCHSALPFSAPIRSLNRDENGVRKRDIMARS